MSHRSLFTLTLLCCVVLAGCGGTNAPATSTSAETGTTPRATTAATPGAEPSVSTTEPPETVDEPSMADDRADVVISGGTLPFDANTTYQRVQSTLGVEGERPPVVVVRNASDRQTGSASRGPFASALGIRGDGDVYDGVAGFAEGDRVYLYVGPNHTAGEVERTLAHEFAHVLLGRPSPNVGPSSPVTADTRSASRSLLEGSATYVASEYADRHLPAIANETVSIRDGYRHSAPATRLDWAHYYFGAEYVDARVDSPADLPALYERPPRTTEQVLHPDRNTSYEGAPEATVADSGSWLRVDSDTRGELFTRVVLGTELDESAAASAAAGWDGDRVVTFERAESDTESYVWTLYWDSTEEADEFQRAAERYVEARTDDVDAPAFRVERTAERSVTLFVGEESFVEGTTVLTDGRTASVDVAEREE